MSGILDLLKPDGYIMANKTIIKKCGLHEAILLGTLCSRQSYWNEHWDIEKYGKFDGYFFCTIEELEEETTLSGHYQRSAFKNLEDKGLIKTSLRGVPAKKYFKVIESKLVEMFFVDKDINSNHETELIPSNESDEQLEVNQVNTNNNKDNNNKNNNKDNNSETKEVSQSKKESKSFIKHKCEVLEIINYLNDKLGTRYRPNASAASKFIPARLEEGFTVDDFKVIIDKKYNDWHGTEWERFLRPSTLFAPAHFEDYLNQKDKVKKPSDKVKRETWDGTVVTDEVF